MAKQALPVSYKDDVLATSMGQKRRYNIIYNDDGTVSFDDVTEYTQVGDNYGAAQLNATNQAVNESVDKATIIDSLDDIMANTTEGMPAGSLAIAELNNKLDNNLNNFRGKVTKMYAGTIVKTAKANTTATAIFTDGDVAKLLGVEKSSNNNTTVLFSNGDGAPQTVHVEGSTWQSQTWYAVYNKGVNAGSIRLNYAIFYWG